MKKILVVTATLFLSSLALAENPQWDKNAACKKIDNECKTAYPEDTKRHCKRKILRGEGTEFPKVNNVTPEEIKSCKKALDFDNVKKNKK